MASDPDWRRAEAEYTDQVIREGTLAQLFESSAARNADREAQWYKGGVYDRSVTPDVVPAAPDGEFASLTYAEMRGVVRNLAAGFRELGLELGDRVGIFADTRMEWAQVDFGLLAAGGVVTTVYTESSPGQVEHLLGHPGATGVVVENGALLERVLEVEDALDLEWIVVMDEHEGGGDREDVLTLTLAELHDRGSEAFDPNTYEQWLGARDPAELATLVYTSGTTGQPKGVRLTHRNVRSNVNGLLRRFGPRPDKSPDVPTLDVRARSLSFLPLAHIFERTVGHFAMFAAGATVAYAESPETVAADVQTVEPTTATSVPRVYERIYDRMREQAGTSGLTPRVFRWAETVARQYARADDPSPGLRVRHRLADRLAYENVAAQLGGNVEFFISGGGSLDRELAELFDGMGLPIIEGYGLTETSPVVSTNPPEDIRAGTLGVPLVDVDVRLDETVVPPDVEPTHDGTLGELLVRGPNVTDGYWEDPDATADAFTELDPPPGSDDDEPRRWFRTGDVVERTDDDYLIYRDRLTELLVLSTGKNVAPGPIESAFATSDRVAQVMVLGDGEKFVSALVVPDFDAVDRWAAEADIDIPDDREALVDDDRVREWIAEAVEAVNADLASHEAIKRFELSPEEWTPDNDLLTPSLKKKRRAIRSRFADRVARIYETEDPPTA